MDSMLFAAGLGTRLYPLTKDLPKALAPFQGGTLLRHNLEYLAGCGIDHFVINTHHFAGKIRSYLEENDHFGLSIELSYEPELLDTAGGLARAASLFRNTDQPILLYNTDVICNLQLRALVRHHRKQKNDVTLAVRKRSGSRYLYFNEEGRLAGWKDLRTGDTRPAGFSSTPATTALAFSGIQLISPDVIQKLEDGRIYSLIDLYLEQMTLWQIGAYRHDDEYWFDCGKPETLQEAGKFLQNFR
jgi:NDP-sugar pyrophosphorylase family protein